MTQPDALDLIGPLAQAYLGATKDPNPNGDLFKETKQDLADAMWDNRRVKHRTIFEGRQHTIHHKRLYASEVLGKEAEAKKWLEDKGIPNIRDEIQYQDAFLILT